MSSLANLNSYMAPQCVQFVRQLFTRYQWYHVFRMPQYLERRNRKKMLREYYAGISLYCRNCEKYGACHNAIMNMIRSKQGGVR